ncbi:hypothetical protein [Asaia spathodeae]|uniref:Uncharacterized protein n=1 Tax=Asaia spathodeae TaxID=657016 RepID=A0ABX2P6C7_9PROT|nr:hypothetical protein [Asaia spathodeae]GBR12425.1 hypothetical protein AA105894_0524 [Asaia spathodeae NBRC 105894]
MRIAKERGRRAATGEALAKALAALNGAAPPRQSPKAMPGTDERDESGALPAGHPVTWLALWEEREPPSYFDAMRATSRM